MTSSVFETKIIKLVC